MDDTHSGPNTATGAEMGAKADAGMDTEAEAGMDTEAETAMDPFAGQGLVSDALIDALAENVAFDGWTGKALRAALAATGGAPDDAPLAFPGGAPDMIEAHAALADRRMAADAAAAGLAALRVPERVRAIIALRLARAGAQKEAIRRALAILSVPANAVLAARITARTADAIWHAAGDRSADFSWYTKRATLAGVYGATLLYWLRDTSEGDEATLAFLDRRLAGVARIGRLRKRIAGLSPFGGRAPQAAG